MMSRVVDKYGGEKMWVIFFVDYNNYLCSKTKKAMKDRDARSLLSFGNNKLRARHFFIQYNLMLMT